MHNMAHVTKMHHWMKVIHEVITLGDGKLISRCTLISFLKVGSGGREKNNIMILSIFWLFNLKSRVEH